ncbi:hypothetical protein AC249_AIPGENE27391 [Exaiptasia diaphana]|nr:hypothetical protein AC249_AIPGENE27391 [Exaiptasia diaphana]
MPFQNNRYLPPLATPVVSRYQTDYTKQVVTPPKSYKSRNITNLPTLAYSNCRRAVGTSSYKDAFEGTHGQAAQSAKPEPYGFPSLDKFETSTYRRDFRKTKTLQLPLLPSSPTRRNNPHPVTMNNAFIFPNRGYWIWPHRLIPMKYEDNSITLCLSNDLLKDKKRGPFETWQKEN